MQITDWVEASKILAGFGGTALIIWFARFIFDHWRWRLFMRQLPTWLEGVADKAWGSLDEMSDEWWAAECSGQLVNAGYAPREIKDLGSLPIDTAKSMAQGMHLMGFDDE